MSCQPAFIKHQLDTLCVLSILYCLILPFLARESPSIYRYFGGRGHHCCIYNPEGITGMVLYTEGKYVTNKINF